MTFWSNMGSMPSEFGRAGQATSIEKTKETIRQLACNHRSRTANAAAATREYRSGTRLHGDLLLIHRCSGYPLEPGSSKLESGSESRSLPVESGSTN